MKTSKKILAILTPGFAANEADTTCLPMQQQMIARLQENNPGLCVKIFSFQYPYHIEKYNWFGLEVIPFNGQNKGGLSRLWLRRKILSRLESDHRQSGIMGLISFWYGECAAVGGLFAARWRLPHFCWISGQDAKRENSYPKKIKLPIHTLVALSESLQDEFEKNHGVRPAHVIAPGIQPDALPSGAYQKDIDLLAVGSLIPLKRYDWFIETVKTLTKSYPNITAVLIGKGPEREKLQEMIYQSGLDKNILLTGELPYADVLGWMRRSKILLHPSAYEGFSGVCLEALSQGAHVISLCKPMKTGFEQWHIVKSKDEMSETTLSILGDTGIHYRKLYPYTLQQTTQQLMGLFKKSH